MSEGKQAAKETGYSASFYERAFGIGGKPEFSVAAGFAASAAVFCVVLAAFYGACMQIREIIHFDDYKYAVVVVSTIFFWPTIIIYDSRLFYRIFRDNLRPLIHDGCADEWYRRNARKSFSISGERSMRGILSAGVMILSVLLMSACAVFGLYSAPATLLIPAGCAAASVLAFVLCRENRYLNTTLLTASCGLAWYFYLLHFSTSPMTPFFMDETLNCVILPIVVLIFLMAGTAVYPMFGTLFAVYGRDGLEKHISTPFEKLAESVYSILKIRKYFQHLSGVSTLAYLQLLSAVYLMGVLNRRSVLTILLFAVGSLMPLIMYCAGDIMFRRLFYRLYLKNVESLDERIRAELSNAEFDGERVQGLAAAREILAGEFAEHNRISIELITTLVSPVISTVLAFIFPIG